MEKNVAQQLVNKFFTVITRHENAMEEFYDKKFIAINEIDELFNNIIRKLLIVTAKELAADAAYVLPTEEKIIMPS